MLNHQAGERQPEYCRQIADRTLNTSFAGIGGRQFFLSSRNYRMRKGSYRRFERIDYLKAAFNAVTAQNFSHPACQRADTRFRQIANPYLRRV